MSIIANHKLLMMLDETVVDFKAEKRGDAAPLFWARKVPGHYDAVEAWRMLSCNMADTGIPPIISLVSRQVQPYGGLSI
jgi:hypothetical protein